MARTVAGEGLAPLADKKAPLRYYAGKCGPRLPAEPTTDFPAPGERL